MSRVPTPLTWKRRQFAVLQPLGTVNRLWAIPVNGLVAGPFAIHPSHYGGGYHVLIHLPSQTKIMDARLQMTAREAAAKYAACDVNWWTCIREEIIGPDSQELKNIYDHYHQLSSIASTSDWRKVKEVDK